MVGLPLCDSLEPLRAPSNLFRVVIVPLGTFNFLENVKIGHPLKMTFVWPKSIQKKVNGHRQSNTRLGVYSLAAYSLGV